MAEPSTVSVVIPAFNEAGAIAAVITDLRSAATWHEIIVVDDGSTDGTGPQAVAAGATVVRHPYNKGNGASVKSGIRKATGEYVLIIDGDGQHKPEDAIALVGPLGDTTSWSAHARRRRRPGPRAASATRSSMASPVT
jgi:glycosyltransferase involved in cell wall biosynthesis